jgi:hypothetical protein
VHAAYPQPRKPQFTRDRQRLGVKLGGGSAPSSVRLPRLNY